MISANYSGYLSSNSPEIQQKRYLQSEAVAHWEQIHIPAKGLGTLYAPFYILAMR